MRRSKAAGELKDALWEFSLPCDLSEFEATGVKPPAEAAPDPDAGEEADWNPEEEADWNPEDEPELDSPSDIEELHTDVTEGGSVDAHGEL